VAPRLEDLDGRERRNHVLVIARYRVDDEDCARLNRLFHLRVTLLVTYSGIADDRIESFPSWVAATSLRTATARGALPQGAVLAAPGARSERLTRAPGRGGGVEPGRARHVFTGLIYRDQITAYHRANGLPEPYQETTRRKIVPEPLERRVRRLRRGWGRAAVP
jgi:hypothetical protein